MVYYFHNIGLDTMYKLNMMANHCNLHSNRRKWQLIGLKVLGLFGRKIHISEKIFQVFLILNILSDIFENI